MKYTPTADNVLIRMEILTGEFGDTGIVRPEIADEMPDWGVVVARGPGKWNKQSTRRLPMTVKPGDRVLIPWSTGTEIHIGGQYHREVCEGEIMAVQE